MTITITTPQTSRLPTLAYPYTVASHILQRLNKATLLKFKGKNKQTKKQKQKQKTIKYKIYDTHFTMIKYNKIQ